MQLSKLIRKRCLRISASRVPTGFIPIKEITKAVVFVDGCMDDCESVLKDIDAFFSVKGIKYKAFALNLAGNGYSGELAQKLYPHDLNWFGRIKTSRKTPKIKYDEDLFISLLESPECFAALQAAVSSNARFKLGRFRDSTFDVVISGGEGAQQSAFKTISNLLTKVSR